MKINPIIYTEWVNRFNYDPYPIFNYDGTVFDKYYEMVRGIRNCIKTDRYEN